MGMTRWRVMISNFPSRTARLSTRGGGDADASRGEDEEGGGREESGGAEEEKPQQQPRLRISCFFPAETPSWLFSCDVQTRAGVSAASLSRQCLMLCKPNNTWA